LAPFNCRNNKRIWLDFENMIINPDINRNDRPQRIGIPEENDQETNP